MQNSVFLPKYTYKGLWDVLLISLSLFSVSIFAIWKEGFGLENLIFLVVFGLFCFWWMRHLVRRIVFTNSSFSVARYLLPTKTVGYFEITDISFSAIRTQKGDIRLTGMSNAHELLQQFIGLIEQGKIENTQLEMKMVVEDEIWGKSIAFTFILSIPVCALLFYIWPFYNYWFSSLGLGTSGGLIIYIVGSVVQWIQKKRYKKEETG